MCGICGFNWEDKSLIRRMNVKLEHRGPDGKGYFFDKGLSLGHRRLSIIDLDARGNNPIYNEDNSICIVFNGEIYNYKALRSSLEKKGHSFSTNTDTEVIIHLYEEEGEHCLTKLNGMFAFCIYDSKKQQLFLARDRIGIKPLYYFYDGEQFIFASEIKSILEHDFKKEVDKSAFETFMTLRFTMEQTLLKNIKKVSPAHYILFNLKSKKLIQKKYWDVSFTKPAVPNTQKLFNLMNSSVSMRLQADVPVGVFLSGGLDSSIITGLASQHHKNINTFSVGFESVTNELPHAKIVSDHFDTNHQEILIKEKDIDQLDKVVYHMDEPISDAAFLPTFFLSKFTKQKASVVLAGEGSDELFTGYDRYKLLHYSNKFRKFLPSSVPIKHDILRRAIAIKTKRTEKEKHMEIIRQFSSDELKELSVKESIPSLKLKGRNLLDKAQYFDLKTLLPNDFCMKTDKMGSAFGVEGRVPFLDHRVVQYGLNLPVSSRLKGWNEKFILKKTFKHLLPKQTIGRRKHGFNTPADAWFKGVLKDKLSTLLDESNHQLYEKEYIQKLLLNFQKSSNSNKLNFYTSQKLWGVLMFEMWYNTFIK